MDWYSGYAAVFPFMSLVNMLCMQSAILFYQLRPLVGLSNAGIVSKPMDITLLTAW